MESTPGLQSAITMSERAEALLPEKPKLARQLIEKAARLARQDLSSASTAEVKALAALYREKLQQPEESLNILRDWLKTRSDRLSKTDAEAPLSLAILYEDLLQDRVTAVELLRKAWRIDPKSKEIAEAFRSRGFRKVKDEWIESTAPTSETKTSPVAEKGLRGLTPDEVIAQLGTKPERVNYVAARGPAPGGPWRMIAIRPRPSDMGNSPGTPSARDYAAQRHERTRCHGTPTISSGRTSTAETADSWTDPARAPLPRQEESLGTRMADVLAGLPGR